MEKVKGAAIHELGHVVAVIALYKQPPRSVIVRPNGTGHTSWIFPIQTNWLDAVVAAGGPAAEIMQTSPIKLEKSKPIQGDFDLIEELGVDPSKAMSYALRIIGRNRKVLDEHWEWFMPRPGTQYRLIKSKDLQFLVNEVK